MKLVSHIWDAMQKWVNVMYILLLKLLQCELRSVCCISVARPKLPVQFISIISAIFDGKILSSVQCLTCERVRVTELIIKLFNSLKSAVFWLGLE